MLPKSVRASMHLFKIAGLPTLVERGLFGPVDAYVGKPATAWRSLDPAALVAFGRCRADVERDRFVGGKILQFKHGPQRGLVLIGLHLRARGGVIERD